MQVVPPLSQEEQATKVFELTCAISSLRKCRAARFVPWQELINLTRILEFRLGALPRCHRVQRVESVVFATKSNWISFANWIEFDRVKTQVFESNGFDLWNDLHGIFKKIYEKEIQSQIRIHIQIQNRIFKLKVKLKYSNSNLNIQIQIQIYKFEFKYSNSKSNIQIQSPI